MKAKKHSRIDEISLVLIVAIVIIVVAISQKYNQPLSDSGKLIKLVLDGNSAELSDNAVIGQKELEKIQGMDYEQLKKYLNMKNDFCLYVEDENGKILIAKGSAKLSRDGIYCKE